MQDDTTAMKSFKDLVLNNKERPYFGMNPVDDQWDEITIKEGYMVYFEGNTIKKTISYYDDPYVRYQESDIEIHTRDRQFVLPQTAKGKEKKLNFTSVSSINPSGCTFSMNLAFEWGERKYTSEVRARNNRNCLELPITGYENLESFEQYKGWLKDYISTCPSDYFEKVEKMRNEKHKTVKYFNGDVFRFELDREHYGFGLIIGQIREMKKDGLFPPEHALDSTMCVPLLIRLYLVKTKDKKMLLSDICSHQLSRTFIMADGLVIWGRYEIIGNKMLEENDVDFPIQIGESLELKKRYFRFCWGPGMIVIHNHGRVPDAIDNNRFLRHAVYGGVDERLLECPGHDTQKEDKTIPKEAFKFFNLSPGITYDDFNLKYGGMTRAQYADYANKRSRTKGK